MTIIARKRLLAVLAFALLACSDWITRAAPQRVKEGSSMGSPKSGDLSPVDHVILGINNLQNGIDELERLTGVRAVFGGSHPGRGTQNALISLGGRQYLEILAPNPAERSAVEYDYLRTLSSLKPVGWAIRTDDLTSLQQSLRGQGIELGEIRPGARDRPDGMHLAWKSMGYAAPTRLLPFFIQWDRATTHPSVTSPGGCKLTGLFLQDRDADRLRKALLAAGLSVEVREAQDSAMRISLASPKGNVNL
jgi:hypothetical protein